MFINENYLDRPQDTFVDQWNKIEYPDMNICSYSFLMYDNDRKTRTEEKRASSKIDVKAGCRRTKLYSCLLNTPVIKSYSR